MKFNVGWTISTIKCQLELQFDEHCPPYPFLNLVLLTLLLSIGLNGESLLAVEFKPPSNRGIPSCTSGAGSRSFSKCSGIGSDRSTNNNIFEAGRNYFNQGQYQEALQSFEKALVEFKNLHDRDGEGDALNGMGLVYSSLTNYLKALDFYQEALSIFKATNNLDGQGNVLNNMGTIYNALGQYPKALEFYEQALRIREKTKNSQAEGDSLNDIGTLYYNQGL